MSTRSCRAVTLVTGAFHGPCPSSRLIRDSGSHTRSSVMPVLDDHPRLDLRCGVLMPGSGPGCHRLPA